MLMNHQVGAGMKPQSFARATSTCYFLAISQVPLRIILFVNFLVGVYTHACIYIIHIHTHTHMYVHTHAHSTYRGQKVADAQELEIQAVVNCPALMLEAELRSFPRTVRAFNC